MHIDHSLIIIIVRILEISMTRYHDLSLSKNIHTLNHKCHNYNESEY